MIAISDSAKDYFQKLIQQQGVEGMGLRLEVKQAGTPSADCQLSFCEPGENSATDLAQDCGAFTLYIDRNSAPFLEEASFDYEEKPTGGQLVIKAPNIRGKKPAEDAPLKERVQYVIDSEITPMVAAHGGFISLDSITDDGTVKVRFGGGCQGCGMSSMTLKNGVEKTLLERFPEIKAVEDVTDHAQGTNPYA